MLAKQPAALHDMLLALDYLSDTPPEIIIVWPFGQDAATDFTDRLRKIFMPNRALLGSAEGKELDALARLAPIAQGKPALGGRSTAYVCRHGSCRLPVNEPDALEAQLAEIRR